MPWQSWRVPWNQPERFGKGLRGRQDGLGLAANSPTLFGELGKGLKQIVTVFGSSDMELEYRCEVVSAVGFVQQLASAYLPHGYWFYVLGEIPEHKDPLEVDAKLISKYGIAVSRQTKARRKQRGLANLHYLRFDRTFVLLATHGKHPFHEEEKRNIRDVRRVPIKFAGYSISVKRGGYKRKASPSSPAIRDNKLRVRVQIGREEYRELKAYLLDIAPHRDVEQLEHALYTLPYEPYAPVRQQLLNLVRLVNKVRKAARKAPVSPKVLRYRRQIVKPFEQLEEETPWVTVA